MYSSFFLVLPWLKILRWGAVVLFVFLLKVTPLTANAPRFGESFSYHIDACPTLTPPGPWYDAFGHYRNRTPGSKIGLEIVFVDK